MLRYLLCWLRLAGYFVISDLGLCWLLIACLVGLLLGLFV